LNLLQKKYQFFTNDIIKRLVRSYGKTSFDIFGDAENLESLGEDFGAGLYELEVKHLLENEWARTAEDILFRRSKLGLIMPEMGLKKLNLFLEAYHADTHISPKRNYLKMQKVKQV